MSDALDLSLRFLHRHPEAAADTLEAQTDSIATAYLQQAPARLAGPVVAHMLPFYAARCLQRLPAESAAGILREIPASTAAVLMRRLPIRFRDQVIEALPRRVGAAIKLLQGYPVSSVGAWLDALAASLPEDISVCQAWQRLREEAVDIDRMIPVVDRTGRLRGCLRSAALLTADPETPLSQLIETPVHTLAARSDLLHARENEEAWRHNEPVPVTARDGRYLGVLRHADLHRGLREIHEQPAETALGNTLLELAEAYWIGTSQLLEASLGRLSSRRRAPRGENHHGR